MNKAGFFLVWLMTIIVLSTGCSGEFFPALDATKTFAPPLNPYVAKTAIPGSTSTPVPSPTEDLVLPTPTPFVHTIQSGDTLYALALQYNVSLDRLVSANPGLDTSMLSVGTEVIIPLEENGDNRVLLPTPHPVKIGEPACWVTKEGGAWCFVDVHNDLEITLENVSIGLNLYVDGQNLVQSYTAIPPLDYYFPDQVMPVSAYVLPPPPEGYLITTTLFTALPAELDDPTTKIVDQDIDYNESKTMAAISGSVKINNSLQGDDQVWVAAIAYNDGNVIGIRKWVSTDLINPDENIPFELIIYSLDPPIEKIQLFSELH